MPLRADHRSHSGLAKESTAGNETVRNRCEDRLAGATANRTA